MASMLLMALMGIVSHFDFDGSCEDYSTKGPINSLDFALLAFMALVFSMVLMVLTALMAPTGSMDSMMPPVARTASMA